MPDASPVTLRRATEADAVRIWTWRNDPDTRQASFNAGEISLADHLTWFARRLHDPATRFMIAETLQGAPFGYVRFDVSGSRAEISLALDPARRHHGLGRIVIRESALLLLAGHEIRTVVALVKPDNLASRSAFRAAGFAPVGVEERGGILAEVFHLESGVERVG